jgi:S1-C subfamily serine protease
MMLVGRTAGRILWTLADAEESLGERRLDFGGAPAPAAPRRALGVMVETLTSREREDLGLAEGESGVRVTHVNDDSVALAAGIETDDVIVSLDGQKLTPDAEYADLPRILNAIKPGKEVEVGVVRNKARKVLKAKWEK